MDRLRFLTPGIPLSTKPSKTMENALVRIKELGLDGMEVEYVRGVLMDIPKMQKLGKQAKELGLILTAHAPYYINFFAREKEKVEKSHRYILDTARLLDCAEGYSVVFHAAYYMGSRPKEVFDAVKTQLKQLALSAKKEALKVWLRPELMGKTTQFGTLDEVVALARELGGKIAPCIDFAHLHSRSGHYNTHEEFCEVFQKIEDELGDSALQNMHMHYSGIRYNDKGEQKHLLLKNSDARYREFLRALKDFHVAGALVVESPNGEGDTLLMKKIYQTM